MNYQVIYQSLIQKRQEILIEGYSEKHHIIPKCLNGSNDKTNLVRLSAREHFIAHQLLYKIYPENYKLICALNYMSNFKKYNSKQYSWCRQIYSSFRKGKTCKEIFGENFNTKIYGSPGTAHPLYNKGHSQKTKDKIKKEHHLYHDVAGKNNPKAKTWIIVDPFGKENIIIGELHNFCVLNKLSFSVICQWINKGKILLKRGPYSNKFIKKTSFILCFNI